MKSWLGRGLFAVAMVLAVGAGGAEALPLHSGDINDDGVRDVADITCYAMATLTNVLGLADPACQAVSDADADLQCTGVLNIVDVQQATLYVLYTLTGDAAIEALQQVNDFDLDFLDNRCDDDDDNDGYPDACEATYGTDPLDPTSAPTNVVNACTCPNQCDVGGTCVAPGDTIPGDLCQICDIAANPTGGTPVDPATYCDDGVGCTDESCDPATGCVHTPNDALCDDGNACTDDACDAAADCIITWNANPCDDGDPCTAGDTCGGGVCLPGGLIPDCFVSRNTICSLSGASGDVVDCAVRVARAAQADAAATSLQLELAYDPALLVPVAIVDPAGGDVAATGTLPSGHTVLVLPSLGSWNGAGALAISPSSDPSAAISPAYVQGTLPGGGPDVAGDPLVLTVQFQLLAAVDPAIGAEVTAEYVAGATASAQPLAATVEQTLVVTRPTGCTADPTLCDDGNPCTTDGCDAASDACVYSFADGTACDDGNPCTHGDACSQGVCVGSLDVSCNAGGCPWFRNGACALDGSCNAWQGPVPSSLPALVSGLEDLESGGSCLLPPSPSSSCGWGIGACGTAYGGSNSLNLPSSCGGYCDSSNYAVETKNLDLTGATSASLDFWASWSGIETCCDYARVLVIDVATGNSVANVWQVSGSGGWTPVHVDLSPWLGQTVRVRWEFHSDGSVSGGHVAIDDIQFNVTY